MLKGDVFKNQTFENHIFALFINAFMNSANGVSKTYKNLMNVTYSGHTVTVDSGACLVQGRLLEEDSFTTLDTGIETMFCKLVVEIDLDKSNTSSVFNQGYYNIVKSSTDYPSLTQQNIVGLNSGKYQFELARFKVSDGVVTDFQDMRIYFEDQLQYGGLAALSAIVSNNYNTLNGSISNLQTSVNGKAPTSHASSASTYGLGNHNYYGHVKAIDNTDRNVVVDGEALGAYQGYWLKTTMNTYNYNLTNRCNSLAQAIDDGDNALRRMINNLSEVPGDFTVGQRLFVDNNSMRSKYTYDNETVTNNPNMYITSNGWIRRTTGSSKRWKKDITEDIEERLNPDALYNLKIKQFKYKDECISDSDVRKGKNILGFIAEDVAEIYEPAVQYDENGQVEMWNTQVMTPAILRLVQKQKIHQDEQDALIEQLKERIKVLEQKAGVINE